MTKANSTIATIQKIHHVMIQAIRKIGKFKDEAAGTPIVEFVGLKSKMMKMVERPLRALKGMSSRTTSSMKTIKTSY